MRNEQKRSTGAEVSRYLGFGLTWAFSTLLFLYLGTLADRWLGTEPVLTMIGAFVGAAAGFYSMYHHLMAPKPGKDQVPERKE